MAGIELRGLSHTFGGRRPVPALADVDLEVPDGAFVSVVGPSGCGKSTILRVLAGLLAPSAGEALVGGESAIGRPGLVAYMPQKDLLLPWRRVLGNATLGAEVAGVAKAEARMSALALMERFGLAGFERSWSLTACAPRVTVNSRGAVPLLRAARARTTPTNASQPATMSACTIEPVLSSCAVTSMLPRSTTASLPPS